MILTALGLVLGQKGEASLVRTGAERLAVAATFEATESVRDLVIEQGGEVDGQAVVLARMITPEGRSRALVGGASAPAGILGEIGEELISIHAQLSTSRLLKPARQRQIVDRFGGHEEKVEIYKADFLAHQNSVAALDAFLEDQKNSSALALELQALTSAFEEVRPAAGEFTELESTIGRLSHHDEIARAVQQARGVISDENGASERLASLRRALEAVKGKDAELDKIIDRTTEVSLLVSEIGADFASYQDPMDLDPSALDAAHSRMSKIQSLLRRFAEELSNDAVVRLTLRYEEASNRLLSLDQGVEKERQLRTEVMQAKSKLAQSAADLSDARKTASKRLSEEVTKEVRALAMPHATVSIDISHREDSNGLQVNGGTFAFDSSGIDHVEIRLAATASTPAVPLAKGASGGELSRVMLALEVTLASADPVPTYVFDEVDAGIGGQAALEVGRRLAKLARHAQVIVVTHLAQVAAFADHHIVVSKGQSGSVTASEVKIVAGAEREAELARMMAGLAESATAQASAAELLALGARER